MAKILVADDEKEIADLLEIYLHKEGHEVLKHYSSAEITEEELSQAELAILDVMMPEKDGFTLCGEIRKKYNFPIIFLTAKVEASDKVAGLALGADDYITKPFVPSELIARVKAQLRRYLKYNAATESKDIIELRGIILNRSTHECFIGKKPILLTPTEFSILWILCENAGNVIKSDEIFREVWKEKYFLKDNNTVMVHIRHLRQKMDDICKNPKYIKTVWGVGYKIEK